VVPIDLGDTDALWIKDEGTGERPKTRRSKLINVDGVCPTRTGCGGEHTVPDDRGAFERLGILIEYPAAY
jgi:hypothetical protein